jgi:hypothetical protein
MNDFSTSLEQLKDRVREACAGEDYRPAKIAAGIRGAVDFCVSNPGAAEILVIDTRTANSEGDYLEMVQGFDGANEALVGAIAAVVAYHLRFERLDRLEEAVPELVCLALLPYLGFDGAKDWAEMVARA